MKYMILLLFFVSFLFSSEAIRVTQENEPYIVGQHLEFYVDDSEDATLQEIKNREFEKHSKSIANFGFLTKAHWFRFKFSYDEAMKKKEWWLSIDYPLLDFVDIYMLDEDDKLVLHKKSGDLYPLAERDTKQHNLAFSLLNDSTQTYTLYVRVKTSSSMLVPMEIISSKALLEHTHVHQSLSGIYYGILLVLIFYNLIAFIYTKEKIYVLYVAFVASYALWQLSFDGLGWLHIWQESAWMREKGAVFFIYTSIFFQLVFSRSLLNAQKNIPSCDKFVFEPLIYLSVLGIIFSALLPYKYTIVAGASLTIIIPLVLLAAGFMVMRKDYYSVRLFVLGWGIFLLGTLFFTLSKFSLVSGYFTMKYVQQAASGVEMILLSAALAERFKRLHDEYTNKLKNHNKNLKLAVELALRKERQKDEMLIEQARLASMGEMIEQIAHQWRQPLNDIALLNQDMYFKKHLSKLSDEDFNRIHESIDNNIRYMSDTIDDFRNYYKSDKKKESYLLFEIVESMLSIIGATLEHSSIKINLDIDKEIRLLNVKNELQQVMLIILNNAKDALISNNIDKKNIEIKAYKDATDVYILVSDNAGGIPKEIKNKIFDPYFTTKHKNQGTGIGLYMSKMIIEKNMQGSLSVENVDGGARFTIKLPLFSEA
ncbi:MAG: sensor histidine kinase [Sulfurimonas sp.]|nr:sensor histidine kinase [Sulfurimonas sp.]